MADRLTELPNSLILEILSFLEMRDVVRTTTLSKRWKNLWTTVPCLDFRYGSSNSDNNVAFRKFVSRALANWKGAKILKFSLRFETEWSFPSSILDSWLLFAIQKQVEELYISLYNSQIGYRAPQRLCFCSSIRRLTLLRCELKTEEGVQWNRLESLTIDSQRVHPSIEHVANQILRGAPRLEFLNLELIESGEDLKIRSDSLKMLKIARCREERKIAGVFSGFPGSDKAILRIQTPNLENLEISKTPYARCLLKVPSLTTASLSCRDPCRGTYDKPKRITLVKEMLRQVLPSIHHVENVTLSNMCSKVLFEMKEDMRIQFPNAKFLKLCLSASSSDKILGVLEMFPQLMILTLEHKNMLLFVKPSLELDMAEADTEPKTILPSPCLLHLRKVEIAWPLHNISTLLPVINFLLENAPLLEKMVLRPRSVVDNLELLSLVEEKLQTMARLSPFAEDYCQYGVQCEKSEVDHVFLSLMSSSLHQLKTVEIGCYVCDASVLPAIEILLQNACMLDKMVFRPYTHQYDQELRLKAKEKVLSMPRSSTTAKVIAIYCVIMTSLKALPRSFISLCF